jgi:hypothetical protein
MKTHIHTRLTPHGVWIASRRGNHVIRSLVSVPSDMPAGVRAAYVDAEIRFICGGHP